MIGTAIKGSVIILLPAYAAYLLFTVSKKNFKKYAVNFLTILLAFAVSTASVNAFINSFDITSDEELETYKFPPHHWIMMGLYGKGTYNLDDFYYTQSSGNYEAKKEADIKLIKERLSRYGILGTIRHISIKTANTWGDGTYMIGYYLKNSEPITCFADLYTKAQSLKFCVRFINQFFLQEYLSLLLREL